MALEEFKTGLDLLQFALKTASEKPLVTSAYAEEVKSAIRSAYWSVLTAEPWQWAVEERYINLVPPVSATVVSIVGATVTLSASVTPTLVGRQFVLDSDSSYSPYRVLTHTPGTATLTIDSTYPVTTGSPTTGACQFYKSDYDTGTDVMAIWGPLKIRGPASAYMRKNAIDLLERKEFDRRYFGRAIFRGNNYPEACTEIGFVSPTDEKRVLRFAPMPENAASLVVDVTPFQDLDFSGTAATDTPIMRREFRPMLAYAAIGDLLSLKDDGKASFYTGKANAMMEQMKGIYLKTIGLNRLVRA